MVVALNCLYVSVYNAAIDVVMEIFESKCAIPQDLDSCFPCKSRVFLCTWMDYWSFPSMRSKFSQCKITTQKMLTEKMLSQISFGTIFID